MLVCQLKSHSHLLQLQNEYYGHPWVRYNLEKSAKHPWNGKRHDHRHSRQWPAQIDTLYRFNQQLQE